MLNLRPPQHTVDAVSTWIYPTDPAWDHERTDRDRKRLTEAAVANLPPNASDEEKAEAMLKAQNSHPIAVWYSAANRYSLTAEITVPEKLRTSEHPESAVPISSYFAAGKQPTLWTLRSLGAVQYRKAIQADRELFHLELVRHGLVRIEQPDGAVYEPDRDARGVILDDWLDWLDRQDRAYMMHLGGAVLALAQAKGWGDEGKP